MAEIIPINQSPRTKPAPLTCEQQKLFDAGLRRVASTAHYYSKLTGSDFDDLNQAGLIGLWGAVQRFDPMRGVLFNTYADYRVRGAIKDACRKASDDVSLSEFEDNDSSDPPRSLPRALVVEPNYEGDISIVADVSVALHGRPRLQQVLRLTIEGQSSDEIAATLSVSDTRVRQLVRSIRVKVQKQQRRSDQRRAA